MSSAHHTTFTGTLQDLGGSHAFTGLYWEHERSGIHHVALSNNLSQLSRGMPQDLCQLDAVSESAKGAAGGQKGLSSIPHDPVYPSSPPAGEPSGETPGVVEESSSKESSCHEKGPSPPKYIGGLGPCVFRSRISSPISIQNNFIWIWEHNFLVDCIMKLGT